MIRPFLRFFFVISLGCRLWNSAVAAENLPGTWITSDGHLKRDLVFLPGKSEMVFTLESPVTGGMQLMRMDLDNGSTVRHFKDEPAGDREFSISQQGDVMAYNVVRGLSSKIQVVSPAGKIAVPKIGKHPWANWPTVSPDGKTLVFVQGARVMYQFDILELPGRKRVRRLSMDGAEYSDYWPKYSPDGKRVVFGSNRDGDFEIYMMNSDGTNQIRLTNSPGIDMHPVFSKAGNRISYTSNRDGNHEIYVLDLADRSEIRITDNPERDDYSCWHPNTKDLLFVSEHGGKFDIRQVTLGLERK